MDEERRRLQRLAGVDPQDAVSRHRLSQSQERSGEAVEGRPLASWLEELDAWDDDVRERAREVLLGVGVGVAPRVAERLSSPEYWSRRRAFEVLEELGALSESLLLGRLGDESGGMRARALEVLGGGRMSSEVVEAHIGALEDGHPRVRWQAARNLGGWLLDVEPGMAQVGRVVDALRARGMVESVPHVRLEAEAALRALC